eukprot:CAMPEP_0173241214 /NCGR_PEP_ID=MMETSP1142-20121109/14255_1 /TAXON_ID=483371 /ORGANISM="non described non described, Strain CCMP2298" /LENGTH=77 /DNA_ID=CAMNT_0014172537 /DNA_START=467 /DNA_END=697 /DNA_ORIENTATION=-
MAAAVLPKCVTWCLAMAVFGAAQHESTSDAGEMSCVPLTSNEKRMLEVPSARTFTTVCLTAHTRSGVETMQWFQKVW